MNIEQDAAAAQGQLKLDPTIQDAGARNELVKKIIDQTPPDKMTPNFIKILTEYLVYPIEKE